MVLRDEIGKKEARLVRKKIGKTSSFVLQRVLNPATVV